MDAFEAILAMEKMKILKEYLKECYPIYIENDEVQISKLFLDIMDKCKK